MSDNCEICSNKCLGFDNNHGGCCTMDDRDFIIGPHPDSDQFVERLSKKLGREIEKKYIFIDFEEGSKLFPNKENWLSPEAYPALRVDLNNPRKPCIFYNTFTKSCMVYDIRPETCRNYECDYLKEQTI